MGEKIIKYAHQNFDGIVFQSAKALSDYQMRLWQELWPNFQPQEMACHGDGLLMIDVDAMCRLQHLRDMLGKPMHINSAYRSPAYNLKIDGAKKSEHLKARAYDCRTYNLDRADYVKLAKEAGFNGIGYYPSFIHIDTGRARSWSEM